MFVISDSGSTGKATFFCQYPYFFLFYDKEHQRQQESEKFRHNICHPYTVNIRKIRGQYKVLETWNISVLINDTAAEIAPFPSAVKNDEVNILKPASKKHSENILKA